MAPKTATEILQEDNDARHDNEFNNAVEHFVKRYRPNVSDQRDAYEFDVALHHLIRCSYREAVKPYERIMSSCFHIATSQPIKVPL